MATRSTSRSAFATDLRDESVRDAGCRSGWTRRQGRRDRLRSEQGGPGRRRRERRRGQCGRQRQCHRRRRGPGPCRRGPRVTRRDPRTAAPPTAGRTAPPASQSCRRRRCRQHQDRLTPGRTPDRPPSRTRVPTALTDSRHHAVALPAVARGRGRSPSPYGDPRRRSRALFPGRVCPDRFTPADSFCRDRLRSDAPVTHGAALGECGSVHCRLS